MTAPWMVDALCAQTDPDLFFPEDDWQTARAAKRVWGGLSERERRRLRRAS